MGLDLPWCTGVLGWESLGVCLADRGRVGACGEGPTCAYVNNKTFAESDSSEDEGYAVPPPTSQPNYSSTYTIIQQPATTTSVVVVGGCPACRVGVLEDTFTCLGVLCAIVFFPIGILFCLALRQRRCPNCGAAFG
nr:PREDICTED: brain protein I3 [Opisthocomus hoazin]